MTREEAKERLKSVLETGAADADVLLFTEDYEAIDMAIKALTQQPCEDCISRQAAIDAIDTYDKFGYTETGCFVREPKGDYAPYIHFDDVIKCIKNAPSVTPQPKIGKWLEKEVDSETAIMVWQSARCSVCDRYHTTPYMYYFSHYEYCPHCGSKMEVSDAK